MANADLPRIWWFPAIDGLSRDGGDDLGTYCAFPLDGQPPVPIDPYLRWLDDQPTVEEWALSNPDASPARHLTSELLTQVLGGISPPPALARLASVPALQAKLRSYTGCYFDLGDKTVPTDGPGRLLHLVSDQQWVRHWMVMVGVDGWAPVFSSAMPVGFLPGPDEEEYDEEDRLLYPDSVSLDDGPLGLTLVADSLEEFLYRWWVETEIAFRVPEDDPLTEPMSLYQEVLRR